MKTLIQINRDKGHTFYCLTVMVLLLTLLGCISFKGITIPPEMEDFYVGDFEVTALNAPGAITERFEEELREKVLSETRLNYADTDPDIEFDGAITRYSVTSVAPQAGQTTAFNRLEVGVQVQYTSNMNEEDNWSQTFTFYQDYAREQNLLDIQDELLEIIFEQILEELFNRAFTDW